MTPAEYTRFRRLPAQRDKARANVERLESLLRGPLLMRTKAEEHRARRLPLRLKRARDKLAALEKRMGGRAPLDGAVIR